MMRFWNDRHQIYEMVLNFVFSSLFRGFVYTDLFI
jgi:hypothetical protein